MREIIVVGLIFIVVGIIGEYYLKKKFDTNRKVNNISKSIKWIQGIVLGLIFIVYMLIVTALLIKYDEFNVTYVLTSFVIVIALVRMFTQWKYNRQANIWILELFTAFLFLALLITMNYIELW